MTLQHESTQSESPEAIATRLQMEHPDWTIAEVEEAVERLTGERLSASERPSGDRA